MATLVPYVRYNGNCREAMNFYKECFGADITIQTVGESPMAKEMPGNKDLVMHATLIKGNISLFASDMMRDKATIGDNVSLSLNCESEEEIKNYFEKLSKGGEIFMPLSQAFWGGLFGMITDRFGVEWMLNYQKS